MKENWQVCFITKVFSILYNLLINVCNTLAYKLKETFHLYTENIKIINFCITFILLRSNIELCITRASFITDQNFLFNQILKA